MKILLLSHGFLACEFKKTAKMILGDFNNVHTLSLIEGADISAYEQDIRQHLNDEDLLVLVDLLGGTPFMSCAKIYQTLTSDEKKKFRVVTGMNLPMVLEIINSKDAYSLQDLTKMATSIGQDGVVDVFKKLEEGGKS